MHSYHSLWLRLSLFCTFLVNQSGPFGFETNEPNPGICAVVAMTQLNVWPRLCRAKSTLVFCEQITTKSTLRLHEELTQGQHLVIMMIDTSLEKDSQASSVLRVYYEPPTSSKSEVELLF